MGRSEAVLRCSGLRKSFGDRLAVDGVGFEIRPGETYGLLGPNGAGKTTSISMIAGLLERDAGEVWVGGEPMSTTSVAAKRHIGLVPQEVAIYPDLTAKENLVFFSKLYGITGALGKRVDEILEIIELTERANDKTDEFSGGMKRRLNIGIGLLHEPSLLILDEPTVGVDPQSRNAILSSVQSLGRQGMAVLYTTHYMEEAERLCDRVAIIDEGKIIAEGTRRELVGLVGQRDKVRLAASGDLTAGSEALAALEGVEGAALSDTGLELLVDDAGDRLPEIMVAAAAAGVLIDGVEIDKPNLEAVFLHLTGRALRE